MHPQLNVDTVHDGAAEFGEVRHALAGGAGAAVSLPIVSAGAGIGRRHQHEGSRVLHLGLEPGDGHLAVFQRPSKRFQRAFGRLAELVQEEDSICCQRHFSGQDGIPASAAQHGRFGGRYVRRPERPGPHEAQSAGGSACHRIHLGRNEAFLQAHGRQNTCERLGNGTFPAARSADKKNIVLPRTGNFHPAFGPFLANDIGKIHVAVPRPGQCFLRLPVQFRVPDEQVRRVFLFFQDAQHVLELPYPEDIHPGIIHRFERRLFRENTSAKSLPERQFHHGQRSIYGADTAIQAQFPHDEVLVQGSQVALPGSRNDSEGDGQVVTTSLLMEIGRGQVNHDFLAGDVKPLGLQGRHRTEETLLDGGIGQSYQVNPHPQGDIHFHRNGNGVNSHAFGAMNVYEHRLIRYIFQ